MSRQSFAVTGVLSAVVLTGLAVSVVQSQSVDAAAHNQVTQTVQRVGHLDNQLKQYVLGSRFGLLRRYDPVVQVASDLNAEAARLDRVMRRAVGPHAELEEANARVQTALQAQMAGLEHFKAEVAILKNSLSYLPVARDRFAADAAGTPAEALSVEADRLVQLALSYTVLPTDELARQLRGQLDAAEAREVTLPAELAFDWTLLLRHCRRIVDQHETLAPILDDLLDAAVQAAVAESGASYREVHADAMAQTEVARSAMVGFIGALVLLFGRVAWDLRMLYANLESRVRSRTRELAARSEELARAGAEMRRVLDNVAEGLVTVSLDGRLGEARSGIIDAWLGVPEPGQTLWAWLAVHDASLGEWVELGWSDLRDGFLPPEVVLDQLPSLLQVGDRALRIRYQPITADGEVHEVLAVISDVTAELEQQRLESVQRETMKVFERLIGDRPGFLEFLAECDALLSALEVAPDVATEKRIVHTIKGNCAIFGLDTVASVCHDVETRIIEEGAGITERERGALLATWRDVQARLEPLMRSDTDNVEVHLAEYEALIDSISAERPHDELAQRLRTWRMEPTRRRLGRVGEQAQRIAERLDRPIQVAVQDNALRMSSEGWSPFWGAMVHVIRNAVDHGIEPAEERLSQGKSAQGTLELSTACRDGLFEILVRDDGRGIDWDAIRSRAQAMGLDADVADPTEMLFIDGISSRREVSELSGRGIGMGAVLATTEELGGTLTVHATAGQGTELRFTFPMESVEVVRDPMPQASQRLVPA